MSEKETLVALIKAVIASATKVSGYPFDYLKGTLSYKENNDDDLMFVITYYGETECSAPELFIKMPWVQFVCSRFIRSDEDITEFVDNIYEGLEKVDNRLHKQYLHRNLPEMCALMHISCK